MTQCRTQSKPRVPSSTHATFTSRQASIHTCTRCSASIITNGDAAWCIPCGRRMRKVTPRATH